MRDGSTAASVLTSLSSMAVHCDTHSWFVLTGSVAALRSGGNMPADHIQSLSRGQRGTSLDSDSGLDSESGEVSSAKHFINGLSSSSLSYMSRSLESQ